MGSALQTRLKVTKDDEGDNVRAAPTEYLLAERTNETPELARPTAPTHHTNTTGITSCSGVGIMESKVCKCVYIRSHSSPELAAPVRKG